MNIKNVAKVFIIFLILILFFNLTQVFATSGDYTNPNQFDSYKTENTAADRAINKVLGVVLTVLRTITFGWSVFSLIYIAIYMLTNASPFDSVKMKENHIPTYILGIILLFGANGILKLITHFVNDTIGTQTNSTLN